MPRKLSAGAQKIQTVLQSRGYHFEVVELPDSTRTAVDAAQAVKCTVGQIAKSLIFQTAQTNLPVLVITSGSNRVDENRIGDYLGEKITKANADFVHKETGFAIGGVPPIGHHQTIRTFIDQDLLQYDVIWAAAGTPHAVFQLTPDALVQVTGGELISVQ